MGIQVVKGNGVKTPFTLEASGYKKFGLLWKLLRNGLLESGTILFWDEPENSLNPEHVPILVDILLELSRNGKLLFHSSYGRFSTQNQAMRVFGTLHRFPGRLPSA